MKKNILAVVLAGCVLFLWGFVSWVILPWHDWVSHKFSDERAVSQVLKQNATTAGVYYLPYAEEDHKPGEAAAFVNVLPNGFDMNMGKLMGTALLGQILSAFLVFLFASPSLPSSLLEQGRVCGTGGAGNRSYQPFSLLELVWVPRSVHPGHDSGRLDRLGIGRAGPGQIDSRKNGIRRSAGHATTGRR